MILDSISQKDKPMRKLTLLKLQVATIILGYKCSRSTVRWCINNGVRIFHHIGSRKKFVLEEQFDWVCYGKFQIWTEPDQMNWVDSTGNTTSSFIHERNINIKHELQHEKNYLSRLQKKISEL